MKKFFLLIAASLFTTTFMAQQLTPLPIDENVRYGVLENGLTYILRHNDESKNRANFYIAQKVGSVLEEDNQRGLAHFLEHMAFNGSEHFPGKAMINYLEKNGVKFGSDLNAYTSFDQTVYNIDNVPVDRENIVDSCLYILYDWSAAISLEHEEIDNERGVILEEWRTRNTAPLRMYEATAKVLFKGTKYPERMPIGTMDVVQNFSYDTLKDYYHKWYRPDLQGIIIVGDINVDEVEAKIKDIWKDRTLDENRAERVWSSIPDNDTPLVSISTDKEFNRTEVAIYCKHKALDKKLKATMLGVEDFYIKSIVGNVFSQRMTEICQKPGVALLDSRCIDGKMISDKDAFMIDAVAKEGESFEALKLIATEIERYQRYGITEGEYERAKAEIVSSFEREYNERAKVANSKYVKEYVNFFLNGGSIMGIEKDFEAIKNIAARITADDINKYIKTIITDKNRVVIIEAIEKEGISYPKEDEILAMIYDIDNADIEPYKDNLSGKELISFDIVPGEIIKEKYDKKLGIKTWTLSNGAKVVLKNTDYKKDQIMVNGVSKGGAYLYDKNIDDVYNTLLFDDIIALSKVGGFTDSEIRKLLAGKRANVSLGLGNRSETVRGVSSVKDIETFLQMTYLLMTDISKDEEAYTAWMDAMKEGLKNKDADPKNAVADSVAVAIYKNNPRRMSIDADDLNRLNYDRIIEIWKERYSNAGDFTFNFVGNIDEESLKPLIEKYIASLPASKKREKYGEDKYGMRHAEYLNTFEKPMENIVATVNAGFIGKAKCSTENMIMLSIFDQVMKMIYTSTIREEEGGTYGVGTKSNMTMKNEWIFRFAFDTNVESMNRLKDRAIKEMFNVVNNGLEQEKFDRVKKYMLKKANDEVKRNSFWITQLNEKAVYGTCDALTYIETIENISIEDVNKFIKKVFKKADKFEVMMVGTKNQ
ncbi:MAG: insulinase family protein [Muribaculaceae bacterium]|nr:insulinase family protein [Muribaculaceae bacterium]